MDDLKYPILEIQVQMFEVKGFSFRHEVRKKPIFDIFRTVEKRIFFTTRSQRCSSKSVSNATYPKLSNGNELKAPRSTTSKIAV